MGRTKELYDNDLEGALLACALADFQYFVTLDVQPRDFHNQFYGQVWGVGQELTNLGDYADAISATNALEARGIDPGVELVRLQARDDVIIPHAPTYAKAVKDLAVRRAAAARLQAALRAAHNSNGTWRDDLARAIDGLSQDIAETTPQSATPDRQTSWNPDELIDAVFPEPVWVVPDLVTVGLTLLAGRPKLGKSMLATQTAIAVGTGGMVLDRRVKPGNVLYLALEDNARRLQKRTLKQGMPRTAKIRFELAWPLLTDNGIAKLEAAIKEHGYNFVIIDTIGRALGRADTQDWSDMNAYVGELQTLANSYDIAILCLDHHRKPMGFVGDPVDDIQGSTAKAAVADCIIGLYKEQGKAGAKLSMRGRDIDDQQLALTWDPVTFSWQYDGTVEEAALRGNKGKVLDALRAHGGPMTQTELAPVTGIDRRNLPDLLNDLVNDGVLERLAKQGREVPFRIREEV